MKQTTKEHPPFWHLQVRLPRSLPPWLGETNGSSGNFVGRCRRSSKKAYNARSPSRQDAGAVFLTPSLNSFDESSSLKNTKFPAILISFEECCSSGLALLNFAKPCPRLYRYRAPWRICVLALNLLAFPGATAIQPSNNVSPIKIPEEPRNPSSRSGFPLSCPGG